MDLILITLLNGLVVLALGVAFAWSNPRIVSLLTAFPRSRSATLVVMGLATVWFLFHVSRLGEADYGNYRHYIGLGFFTLAILAYFFTPDFLVIRGTCVLLLLTAKENLDAAYMEWEHPQRLFLVTFTYLVIFLALYLAVSPFRVRDFLNWAFDKSSRAQVFGAVLALIGAALVGTAVSMV